MDEETLYGEDTLHRHTRQTSEYAAHEREMAKDADSDEDAVTDVEVSASTPLSSVGAASLDAGMPFAPIPGAPPPPRTAAPAGQRR